MAVGLLSCAPELIALSAEPGQDPKKSNTCVDETLAMAVRLLWGPLRGMGGGLRSETGRAPQ